MAFYTLSVFQSTKCKTIQVSEDSSLLHFQATSINSYSSFVAFTKLCKALLQLAVGNVLGLFAVRMLLSLFRIFAFYVLVRSAIFDKDTLKYRFNILHYSISSVSY